ncbi:MAG: hypothetical protein LBC31_04340 [Treponema sp.]|nr:hypothetical protein [Treponema sp.]
MPVKLRVLLCSALCCFVSPGAGAQEWYRSNPSGMALERISSRTVALHYEWALSVDRPEQQSLPPLLRPYYQPSYTLEQRLLYNRGKLKRRQWIFRDPGGITRVNASLPGDLASIGKTPAPDTGGEIPPFIELFAPDRSLSEIHQHLPSGLYTTSFVYREGLLIRQAAFLNREPLWTDEYRYTRSATLRGMDRVYHQAGRSAAEGQAKGSLPAAASDLRSAPPVQNFIEPGAPYDYGMMNDVLPALNTLPTARSVFDTDSRGRVLTETRYDEEENVIAVLTNDWTGDRIKTIHWTAGKDQGRVVFTYSGGDRIAEDDYKNGVLERKVVKQGDEEIEELYIRGKVMLRTVWKDGRKVSEERLR